ncbi:MAG: thermonuclease family protein [Planctomycetia bacterium]
MPTLTVPPRSRWPLGLRALPVALLLVLSLACVPAALRADDGPAPAAPAAPAPPEAPKAAGAARDPLVVGVFPIGEGTVVDGDTVRVPDQPSIRIVGLDCEEVFHRDRDRQAAEADFKAYARDKRGDSPLPVKYGTPAGEAARDFVRQLLAGATALRIERDGLQGPERDGFDRLLGHVIVLRPGRELNLALELVRAGHSPYFVKYGRNRRLDAEFEAAQAEAREARRGIWGSAGPDHYPDYDERLAWWAERAAQVSAWRAAPDAEDRIELGTEQASQRLAARAGKPVTLFGTLGRMRLDEFPFLVFMAHQKGKDIPVVFRDRKVLDAVDPVRLARGYVVVRGTLTLYRGSPQVEVEDAGQVSRAP